MIFVLAEAHSLLQLSTKEAGANEVYLYVTHCENTIHSGTVLTDGLISRVFTTDSIYRGNSEMISLI